MNEYMEFLKNLFFAMLYFTGILACFCICINFIDITIHSNRKEKRTKVVNIDGDKYLDEETKKELDKIAQKIANEMLSDEYEKED